MGSYKEYRSVTEFPLHTDKLSKDELEKNYKELRSEYRSLSISRGSLVGKQKKMTQKLANLHQELIQVSSAFQKAKAEEEKLKGSLSHSMAAQADISKIRNSLAEEVDSLMNKLTATTNMMEEFETVYQEVQAEGNPLGFWRLLKAAKRLLTTDINDLMPEKLVIEEPEEWTKTDTASINRKLLDR